MPRTSKSKHLRLTCLTQRLDGSPRSIRDIKTAINLALAKQIVLFAAIPSDLIVHVEYLLPFDEDSNFSFMQGDANWTFGIYRPDTGNTRPEMTHVVFATSYVRSIRDALATRLKADKQDPQIEEVYVAESIFKGGLAPHPSQSLAKNGWFMRCEMRSTIVLGVRELGPQFKGGATRFRRKGFKISLKDLYFDEADSALLRESDTTAAEDVYSLRGRAPGVYILYQAAEKHYNKIVTKEISFEEARDDLAAQLLPKLKTSHINHVAKFINPRHRRGSGVASKEQKHFDKSIIEMPDFHARYRKFTYVQEGLALILYVTTEVLRARDRAGKHEPLKSAPTISTVITRLEDLGFYPKEAQSIARLIFLKPSL